MAELTQYKQNLLLLLDDLTEVLARLGLVKDDGTSLRIDLRNRFEVLARRQCPCKCAK